MDSRPRRRRQLGPEPRAHEVTPEHLYLDRRAIMKAGVGLGVAGAVSLAPGWTEARAASPGTEGLARLGNVKKSKYSTEDAKTSYDDVTSYNNFYEFGTAKSDPAENAHILKTRPWSVAFSGEMKKGRTIDIDQLIKSNPLEDRTYRLRCVEAWSMVVPWVGFPLGPLLKSLEPTSNAKYVAFETLQDPKQMPGQNRAVLEWPYVEGLRMDEAMNPLTILCVGLYGKVLPNQNGAPVRLIVPWKYGFKSIKSIVKIKLVEKQPPTSWNLSAPGEYGFYSNVNPEVDHPRWSQKKERRIGNFFKVNTQKWNGYGEQVAAMYKDLDLKKNF